ncbi:MAG: hypothetical protein A3J74_08865 [Elusimicrobia bacterium RIFCSPHIGHO2_02_FULL_57_9]|nr:MAG: hypothetical protein A3J74_08865 [Elusimicrobia bacterium RIFCSPHIGHO2_02_FULL_57_9]
METRSAPIAVSPSLGGSLPLSFISEALDRVSVVSSVYHDNNQHAPNENLRLKNLWDSMEIFAALIARIGHLWPANSIKP